ncbi:fumarylacetoacetate hydrolase family protein [Talaromyces proteolyticus]|uniref:Fumarylacetoacetate hydrolase family protein n=1 Tax=Talaromyces proteolyticus TaxID=1131652 RepID=A0AAD4PVE5_9EURO|nr:fumarylacetoacetate hydrolase family protein [Talaromyces proteolyticus]KAH8691268.1 fumarylacetoacetate hydrolase family protein [Talaromyces proteolyticus]
MSFHKLVRFEAEGHVHYGDLLEHDVKFTIRRLNGSPFTRLDATKDIFTVDKLLCPLEHTPIVICVGLNYRKHAEEANLPIARDPIIFMKPSDALAASEDIISVHPGAQEMLDFEGELVAIIGRDAKNVSEEAALDIVLGYTTGNDLSARNLQLPQVSGGQFCYAKSFDGFAPIGSYITTAEDVSNPQTLNLVTKVNGAIKQQSSTADMIWTVRQIIAHLSRGITLRKGTIIMTGTPSGVGFSTGQFLKDGDVVEVEISNLGSTRNKLNFE